MYRENAERILLRSWNRFDRAQFKTEAQIGEWVASTRHKVMYRDAGNVDEPGQ